MESLFDLMRKHDAQKAREKYYVTHHYVKKVYPTYFEPIRYGVKTILEIGVAGGGSIKAWNDYFPNAEIVGVECHPDSLGSTKHPKHWGDFPRVHIELGDQGDREFMTKIAEKYGPFDIIIDDGSHEFERTITSFNVLRRHLRQDGFYAIEDVRSPHVTGLTLGEKGMRPEGIQIAQWCADNALKSLRDGGWDYHFHRYLIVLQRKK